MSCHLSRKIAIRSSDNAGIDLNGAASADPFKALFLDEAKKLGLEKGDRGEFKFGFSRSRRLEFLNDLRDATLAGLAFKALADAASFRRFENSRNVEVSVRYKGAHFDVLRIIKT